MSSRASCACVNWNKTETLFLGQWQENPPHFPQQCSWNKEGLRMLGISTGKLNRWRRNQPQLSYRDRGLVINNLAASMLWQQLMVVGPPLEVLHQLVDFVLRVHHWPPPNDGTWSLPVCESGQSLIHPPSKRKALKLQTAQTCSAMSDILMSNNTTKTVPTKHFHETVFKAWLA